MSEKLKEVCAYVRVSTNQQEELSPDSQIRLIKEYAQAHGMLLTRIYKETHGISGKIADKRPAFQEMIAMCKDKSHPYDAILLWKFSRFARNMDESSYYKSILRKKCNVDVISISEPIIEGMYGKLIETIIEWTDEFYLYNLSGEVTRGMTQNAMRGGYNANAPFGYMKKPKEVPVIQNDEALIIRKIFHMYVNEKRVLSDIASILNKQGIKTRRGNKWETRTIVYILENPFYIGKIRWNYYDKNKNSRKNTDDVIISDGEHEPIISGELFTAAGERLATERTHTGYGKKHSVASRKHWLSGMIKCSDCGSSLAYNKSYEKYRSPAYFSCWKRGKGMCNTNNYISQKDAEKEVFALIEQLNVSQNGYIYNVKKVSSNFDDDIALIKKELTALSAKERRIKDAYVNGIDTLEEYKENKLLLTKKRDELNEQLQNLEVPEDKRTELSAIDLTALLHILQDEDVNYVDKGNSIREVFDHFVWNSLNKTFDAVFNASISPEK